MNANRVIHHVRKEESAKVFSISIKSSIQRNTIKPMQDGFWHISLQQVKSFFNRELGNHFTFLAVVSNLSNAVSIKYEKFPRHLRLLLKKFHCLKSLGSMSTIVALFKTFFSICLKPNLFLKLGKFFTPPLALLLSSSKFASTIP